MQCTHGEYKPFKPDPELKKYECNECGWKTCRPGWLKTHMEKVHPDIQGK